MTCKKCLIDRCNGNMDDSCEDYREPKEDEWLEWDEATHQLYDKRC